MTVEEVKKELKRYQKLLSTLDEKEQEYETVKASVYKPIKAAVTRNGGLSGAGVGNPVYELIKNWETVKSGYVKDMNEIVSQLLKIKYMLSALPVECDERRALECRYIQDMTDAQVARELKVSRATVHRLYNAAYEMISKGYI